jgi:hypothetical protein
MDAVPNLDWPSIIREAAESPLGVMALAMIIIGLVAVAFFYKERDPRYRLAALVIIILGIGAGALSIQRKVSEAGEIEGGLQTHQICDSLKGEELIKCLQQRDRQP